VKHELVTVDGDQV